jgi:hypothetical protein
MSTMGINELRRRKDKTPLSTLDRLRFDRRVSADRIGPGEKPDLVHDS